MTRRDHRTAAPARNFTLSSAERIAATIAGPPAWARRLRRIEDLRFEIKSALKASRQPSPEMSGASSSRTPERSDALRDTRRGEGSVGNGGSSEARARARRRIEQLVEQLRALVEAHNSYYPIEANLPIDPRTGRIMDRGEPWQRMAVPTLDELVAQVR